MNIAHIIRQTDRQTDRISLSFSAVQIRNTRRVSPAVFRGRDAPFCVCRQLLPTVSKRIRQ